MIRFEKLTEAHVPAARAFNQRLEQAGIATGIRIATQLDDSWLPAEARAIGLSRTQYVALDGLEIRGGYKYKEQPFLVNGQPMQLGMMQAPISEGLWESRYKLLGALLLVDTLKRNRNLYALGMGGHATPYARLVKGAKWAIWDVPFLFRVLQPSPFLRNIRPLRSTRARCLAMDLVAALHLGDIPARIWYSLHDHTRGLLSEISWRTIDRFDGSADLIWDKARGAYSLIAVRDQAQLNALYAESDPRFHRLLAMRDDEPVGWVVVMSNKHEDHKHFGRSRLGSIIDALAVPGYENHIAALATSYLRASKPALIVSNQGAAPWTSALLASGYHSSRSNFLFAISPSLVSELGSDPAVLDGFHVTRNDGDGPIHL